MRLARPLTNDEPSTYFCDELKPKNMRNFATLMALAAISFQGLAQKEVVSAYNANKEGDFATAASYIEQAIENPKAKVKTKTWRYRADIYLNISKDSTLFTAFPDALTIAKESLIRAQELDSKGAWKEEVSISFGALNEACNLKGIESYNAKNYADAGDKFTLAFEVGELVGAVDTNALYNAGLSYKVAQDRLSAEQSFRQLASIGYQPINMTLLMAEMSRELGDSESAIALLNEGIASFPLAQELYIEKFNVYNSLKVPVSREIFALQQHIDSLFRYAKATDKDLEVVALRAEQDSLREIEFRFSEKSKSSILAVVEADSTNVEAWYACAVTLMDLDLVEEGIDAYTKLLELDSTYQAGWFNFGLHYYDEGVEMKNRLGDFPLRLSKSEQARFDNLKKEMNANFEISREYWNTAFELDMSDCAVIQALINVNIYLKDLEGQDAWRSAQEATCK